MPKHIYIKTNDKMFDKFDNYEVWPCALVLSANYTEICNNNYPDIAFWSIFGHMKIGGIECISDHETFDEALKFLETLPQMPLKTLGI